LTVGISVSLMALQELILRESEFSRLMQESGIRSDEEVDDEAETPDTAETLCPGSPWSDIGKVLEWMWKEKFTSKCL
jgi:hypothetical protein